MSTNEELLAKKRRAELSEHIGVEDKRLEAFLAEHKDDLREQEYDVVCSYFGINAPLTILEKIGERYGVGRPRTAFWRDRALNKLRDIAGAESTPYFLDQTLAQYFNASRGRKAGIDERLRAQVSSALMRDMMSKDTAGNQVPPLVRDLLERIERHEDTLSYVKNLGAAGIRAMNIMLAMEGF